MGLPSKKRPKSEKRKRRAVKKLKKITLSLCPNCKKPVFPHRLCPFCGIYAGKEIISPKIAKKSKKEKK